MDDTILQPAGAARACARLLALLMLAPPLMAAQFDVRVESDGVALADAVASLHPEVPVALPAGTAEMDQVDANFLPGVLPITVGTRVRFPNSDNTLHQVYSFSPTKRFELPLYSGRAAEPILFDTAGVVAVGCNIHDWMIGHIVVLDTPYFARTDAAGHARIEAPSGRYRLDVWHARANPPLPPQALDLVDGPVLTRSVQLTLDPPPPPRPGNERLRALQEKFHSLGRDP